MVRTPCCDKTGLKKGTWTPEEDRKLIAYVTRYGCWNWRRLPKFAGLSRCGKSCRLRWLNYLRPNVKRGNFSIEEEEIIIRMHEAHGNKWSMIAAKLDGRTDNDVKNHWHTNIKKRFKPNKKSHEAKMKKKYIISQLENSEESGSKQADNTINHQILESFPVSPPQPSSSSELSNSINWQEVGYDNGAISLENYGEINGDFWTEPFVADSFYVAQDYNVVSLIDPEYEYLFSQSPVSNGEFIGQFGCYEEEEDFFNW